MALSTTSEEGCQVKKRGKPCANMLRNAPTEAKPVITSKTTKPLIYKGLRRRNWLRG